MADWNSLPRDLINLIAQKLFIPDLVRISYLCTWWFSCLEGEIRRNLPRPWILKLPATNNGAGSFVYPFDRSMTSSYKFHRKVGAKPCGFCKGFVYFYYADDEDDMNSVIEGHDPITGKIICYEPLFNFNNARIKVLSSGSCSEGIEVLLADKLWRCESRESDWFELNDLWYIHNDIVLANESVTCVKDLLVDNKIHFLMGRYNVISVFEGLDVSFLMAKIEPPQPRNMMKSYLLKYDNDVYMVCTYHEPIVVVRVYKLDKSRDVPSWSPISNLEGKSFFCSDYNCFVMSDIEVPGSLVNHVYLLGGFGRNDMVVFSMVKGFVQVLSLDEPGTSFVSLWYLFE